MDAASEILKGSSVSELLPCITLPFTRVRWYTSRGLGLTRTSHLLVNPYNQFGARTFLCRKKAMDVASAILKGDSVRRLMIYIT